MKRVFSVLLSVILILNFLQPISFSEQNGEGGRFIKYYDNEDIKAFVAYMFVPKVRNGGIAYRTIGLKSVANVNGTAYTVYQPLTKYDDEPKPGPDGTTWISTEFRITREELYTNFKSQYPAQSDVDNLSEFFGDANSVLILDALITTVLPNGTVEGAVTGVSKTLATVKSGKIAENMNEFKGLVTGSWSSSTLKAVPSQYFNLKVKFSPIIFEKPVAIINGTMDGNRAIRTVHTFGVGQIIDIDGRDSKFNDADGLNRKFTWEIRNANDIGFGPPIENTGGSPFDGSEPVGEYVVRLKVTQVNERAWDKVLQPVESDYNNIQSTTRIIIAPNPDPTATATVKAPKEIKLEKNQYSATVPVTISGAIKNLNIDEILQVELEVSTQEGDQVKKQAFYPQFTPSFTTNFTIPCHGELRSQVFKGKTIVTLKGGSILESSFSYAYTAIYKESLNKPPVPILSMPEESYLGGVTVSGRKSYDLDDDGYIVSYDFEVPLLGYRSEDNIPSVNINFPVTGTFQVILGVTDNEGARSETSGYIKIVPPSPAIYLESSGNYKENRIITLKAYNYTEMGSPIGDNYNWTIKPMDVTAPQSNVIMPSSHGKNIDIMLKTKGKYLVTCTGTNTYNMSDTKIMVLNVVEDKPPVVSIRSSTPVTRNEDKVATITARDASYSTDRDYIEKRDWYYIFDSNNDGSFDGEAWHYIKTSTSELDTGVSFTTSHVGRYEIYLAVTETFGQPTMPAYLSPSDYKKGYATTVVEVDNIAPVASTVALTEKKIDISIVTDYEGQDLINLQNRMNQFKVDGAEHFRNVNFNIVSGKTVVGKEAIPQITKRALIDLEYNTPYVIAKSVSYSDSGYAWTAIEATNENVVTTTFHLSEEKVLTKKFEENVKDVKAGTYAAYVLFENGDLYVCGNMARTLDNSKYVDDTVSDYHLVMTNVKSIRNDSYESVDTLATYYINNMSITRTWRENLYVLKNDGTVWKTGCNIDSGLHDISGAIYENQDYFRRDAGISDFVQILGFNNIVKIECMDAMIVGMTADHQFYVAGKRVGRVGGYVRSGVKRWPNSSWVTVFGDNTINAIKIENIEQYGFIDVVHSRKYHGSSFYNKMYFVTSNKALLEVVTEGGGWKLTWHTGGQHYYNAETPFTTRLKLYKQFPQDFVSLIPSLNSGNYNYILLGSYGLDSPYRTDSYIYNYHAYFNGTKILAQKGIEYTEKRDVSNNDNEKWKLQYFLKPPPENAEWVEVYNEAGGKTYLGRNIEVISTEGVKSTPLRDKSSRYMIYLAKGDSFKSAKTDLLDYVKNNNFTVMASCDPQYYDKMSGLTSQQITLNQLVSASPQGKKYGLNSLETILSEINQQNKIKFSPDGGLYLILGEDTATYYSSYTDNEKDPLIHAYYHTAHDPNYFTNGTGLSTYNNTDLVWPPTSFDKVGKYKLDYYVIDNPTLGSDSEIFGNYRKKSKPASIDVYVHRRPIANFDLSYNYQSTYIGISPLNYAYDLDHIGAYWNGITKVEYKYRLNGEPSWHDGIPWGLNYGDTLEVSQIVTDLEGATNSIVKTFTMPTEMPLVLTCELKTERPEFSKTAIPASESLRLTNIIVDRVLPHGIEIDLKSNDGLINQKYTEYTNSNTVTYTDSNGRRQWHDILIRLPETYKDGGYKVEVKLKDIKNTNGTSYQVKTGDQVIKTLDFSITTPVKLNASITTQSGNAYDLKGITGRYSKETIVKLFSGTPYEKTLSIPKTSETHKSNHLLDEATWLRNVSLIGADIATGTPAPTGQYIARFETKTASGNRAIAEVLFDYKPVTVKSFDARGYWNHWRGQTTLKGEVTTVEPHRFLAHECVIFEALIQGEIEGAMLRLSPELESMTYWDKYNNLYRYEDDFHMKVYFPVQLKKVGSTAEGDLWQYEYALPYADSTQSFENERLKPSYKATLYVIPKGVDWHGDYTTKGLIQHEIADIDITGNIHDLLYIEPVRGSQ